MTKESIIEHLARENIIKKIVKNLGCSDFADDLTNDIILSLLNKDEGLIQKLYNDDTLIFYIIRMVKNNLYSTTSPYYYIYKRYQNNKSELKNDSWDITYEDFQ